MSDRYIHIPDWDEFQHYKDKTRPAWIKVYPRLLRNDRFMDLTVEQRLALIGIWLLYAETSRKLSENTSKLSRQLGQRITKRTLNSLNEAGFIEFRSRDALETVYTRGEKRREDTSLKDQRPPPVENPERISDKNNNTTRGAGWVDNLGQYTGCRYVRGEFALTPRYDPLGTEPPPRDWPYERPTRDEIRKALEEVPTGHA